MGRGSNVVVTFSEAMDKAAPEAAFSLKRQGGNAVVGAFSWSTDSTVLTFNPGSELAESATYNAKVGTGAKDAAANALGAEKGWSFDSVQTTPDGVFGVAERRGVRCGRGSDVVVTFSETMDRSASEAAFSLKRRGGKAVAGAFSWS